MEAYTSMMASAESGFAVYLLLIAGVLFAVGRVSTFLPSAPILNAHLPRIVLWPLPGWTLALVFGFLIRLPHMTDVLWYDETFTAALARLPDLNNLFTVVLADVHPPTNYFLTWLLVRLFGDSEVVLRIPALMSGVLLIYLSYRLALALGFSDRVATLTSWLIALMPSAVQYSNEARQYALLACLAFGVLIAILDGRPRWFAVLCAALPWTHNLGYFYAAVLGTVALALHGRRWILPVLLAALAALAWLPGVIYQSRDVADGFWVTPLTVPGVLFPLGTMTITGYMPSGLVILTYTPLLAGLIAAVAWSRAWYRSKSGLAWAALTVGVPVSVALASWLWRPVYLHRALLPCVLAMMPVLARFLLEKRNLRGFWQIFVLGGLIVALIGYYHPDYLNRRTGPHIAQECAGANAIYNTSLTMQFYSTYYAPGIPSYLSPFANDLSQSLPDTALDSLGFEVAHSTQLGQDVCIVELVAPFANPDQVDAIRAKFPPRTYRSTGQTYTKVYSLIFHRLGY